MNPNEIHVPECIFLLKDENVLFVLQEPFMLEKCVVSQDPEFTEVFEVLEWNKESLIIKVGSISLNVINIKGGSISLKIPSKLN